MFEIIVKILEYFFIICLVIIFGFLLMFPFIAIKKEKDFLQDNLEGKDYFFDNLKKIQKDKGKKI